MYPVSDKDIQAINNTYAHHPFKKGQGDRFAALKTQARSLALAILTNVPPSRERAVALTRLEEVTMWAINGISTNESD